MPHIVFLFCDNVGWSNLGYHRSVPTKEVVTPNIDALARTGLELDRMYTYKFCSPSRSSLLTGRLPMHVNIYNSNPAQPGAGIPIGMTLISEKLTSVGTMCSARCVCTCSLISSRTVCLLSLLVPFQVGYESHFVGKWHVGMATYNQTPVARGFKSSLGYFHSENDYFTQERADGPCRSGEGGDKKSFVDLWDTSA